MCAIDTPCDGGFHLGELSLYQLFHVLSLYHLFHLGELSLQLSLQSHFRPVPSRGRRWHLCDKNPN